MQHDHHLKNRFYLVNALRLIQARHHLILKYKICREHLNL